MLFVPRVGSLHFVGFLIYIFHHATGHYNVSLHTLMFLTLSGDPPLALSVAYPQKTTACYGHSTLTF